MNREKADKKFGETSAFYDGAEQYIRFPDNGYMNFGSDCPDFCMWVRDRKPFSWSQKKNLKYWLRYIRYLARRLFGMKRFTTVIEIGSDAEGKWAHIEFGKEDFDEKYFRSRIPYNR